MSQLETKT